MGVISRGGPGSCSGARPARPHTPTMRYSGLLPLLHAASSHEVCLLRCGDINRAARTLCLGRRPAPLDPPSRAAVQRCLDHRSTQRTDNPHLVVTKGAKTGHDLASTVSFIHLLDPAGFPPRTVHCSRLANLVNTMGLNSPSGPPSARPPRVRHLNDHVDPDRLSRHSRTRDGPSQRAHAPRTGALLPGAGSD